MKAGLSSASRALALVGAMVLIGACGGGFRDDNAGQQAPAQQGPVKLQLMIGSSGDAETNAVNAAAKAWATKTGNTVDVIPAKDINQQLTQALAGGTPPDVFYVDASRFATLAESGALAPIGDRLQNPDDFYPALRQTFTYQGKLACAPKDFSTLALQVNTSMWAEARLTEADVPTTWDQLEAVAKKLSAKDHAGLVIGDTRDRIGAFMRQAGGWITSPDSTRMTADTPQNLVALQFVQKLLKEGGAKFPKQVDAGWSGEALGKKKAAMVIEGNWIQGAMKADFPDVKYASYELPVGPSGKGTLTFTQCWGVAAKSKNQDAAVDFVNFLTTPEQQMKFADAFGVMPSRQSVAPQFEQKYPEAKAFILGADYAQGPVTAAGFDAVLSEFDAGLYGLSDGSSDPKKLLADLQKNGTDALGG
jgi:multiple sugar transport system substrate-binding protein